MGTRTLLNGVNEILKRVNVIAGDASAFTSLTDAAQQHAIDIAIQVINEGVDQLYTSSSVSLPNEQAQSTITLVTGTREYTLPSTMVTILWPMIDRTNTQYIFRYPGDYNDLLILDPEQNDTGQPQWGIVSPVTGKLYLDRTTDAASNGRVYTFQYEKDLSVSLATDTFPFSDAAFRAMVQVWAQLWKREMKNEFDQSLYLASMGRAARYLTEEEPRTSYFPR